MKDYYTVPIYIRPDDAVIMVYPGGMMMAKVKGCKDLLRISTACATHWIHLKYVLR